MFVVFHWCSRQPKRQVQFALASIIHPPWPQCRVYTVSTNEQRAPHCFLNLFQHSLRSWSSSENVNCAGIQQPGARPRPNGMCVHLGNEVIYRETHFGSRCARGRWTLDHLVKLACLLGTPCVEESFGCAEIWYKWICLKVKEIFFLRKYINL